MKTNRLTWLLYVTFWITFVTLILMTSLSLAGNWQPDGFNRWLKNTGGQAQYHVEFGAVPENFPTDYGGWAKIVDTFVTAGTDSIYCHSAILRTTIYPDGSTRIALNHNGSYYSVTEELLGIGWINRASWAHQWIDNRLQFATPVVDSNLVKWTGISPGVDYSVTKVRTGLQHGIHFRPSFLDSAATLYGQRSDSAEIGLANIFRYSFENIDGADSAVGDVATREFLRLGKASFGLSHQHLYYPGWDSLPAVEVRQYWKRVDSELYCIEWIPMCRVNQAHLAYPDSTIWHNLVDSFKTSSEIIDGFLSSVGGQTTQNFGGHDHWVVGGTSDSATSQFHSYFWFDIVDVMDTSANYLLDSALLSVTIQDNAAVDDTVRIYTSTRDVHNYTGNNSGSIPDSTEMDYERFWEGKSLPDSSWTLPGGDKDWSNQVSRQLISGTQTGNVIFYLDSAYVDSLIKGIEPNYGFWVEASDSSSDNQKRFYSVEYSTVANRPKIALFYQTDDQQIIYPADTIGDVSNWVMAGGTSFPDAVDEHDDLKEVKLSYMQNSADGSEDMAWQMDSCTLNGVDSVITFFRANETFLAAIRVNFVLGNDTTYGTTRSLSVLPEEFTEVLTRPGGGAWSPDDIANMKVVFDGQASGWSFAEQCHIYWFYIRVYGSQSTGSASLAVRRRKVLTQYR